MIMSREVDIAFFEICLGKSNKVLVGKVVGVY